MDPQALFVYGSLLFPDIVGALLGRVPDHSPAAARGWRAAALPGRVYPGLVPAEGITHGHLLSGLAPEEWRILDAFEGPAYERKRLDLVDGRQGWVYAWNGDAEARAEDWSAREFAELHLLASIERCVRWRRHYETHGGPPAR